MTSRSKKRNPKFRFWYTGIRVKDLNKSITFYTKILGMRVVRRGKMPHGGEYVGLRTPGSYKEIELNWYPATSEFYTKYAKGDEMDHLAFVVDDVSETFEYMKKKGVKVAVSPSKAKGLTEVYFEDPNGIWIELLP